MNTVRVMISAAEILAGVLFLRGFPYPGFHLDSRVGALVALPLLTVETFIGLLLVSTGVFHILRRS